MVGARLRRHLPGAVAMIALLAAVLLATAPRPAGAADELIGIQLEAGYGGSSPPGGWVPVQVTITNKGPDIQATLTITMGNQGYSGGPFPGPAPLGFLYSGGGPGGPIRMPAMIGGASGIEVSRRLPVALPTGTTKHFLAYLPATPGQVKAVVRSASGRSLASSQTQLSFPGGNVSVAVISDNRNALNQLGSVQSLTAAFGAPPQLVHIAAASLPDAVEALAGFRMIAIDDVATESFTASQRQALDDYAARGGSLLITGGAAWHRTLAGLPAGLAPFAPNGTQTMPGLPQVSAQLESAPVQGSVEVAVGNRTAGVTALTEGSVPILVDAPRGMGRVLYLAIDPAAEPVASWSGTLPLLRQAIVRASTTSFVTGIAYGPYPGGPGGIQAQGPALFQALANIPSLDLPSPELIAVALAVFILLVGPVNHFVLKRIRRPDLAWGTIPVLVAVSAGSIYGIGLTVRGTEMLADRIRLVYLQSGSNRAFVAAGTGVFAPHSGSHAVSTTNGSMVGALSGNESVIFGGTFHGGGGVVSGRSSDSLVIEAGNPDTVRMTWANPGSMQAFGEEYVDTQGGGIEQHLTVGNGRITGTIVNHLPVIVSDAVVLSGTAYKKIGAMRPGESIAVDIALPGIPASLNGPGNATPLPTQIYLGAPPVCLPVPNCGAPGGSVPGGSRLSPSQREATRRSDVLAGILGSNQIDVPQPLLVAWSSSSTAAGEVRVDGRRTQLKELDAFIVPLTPEAFGTSLPAGVVPARTVDTTGGSLVANVVGNPSLGSGAETLLEFALPGARGGPPWTKLALTATMTVPLPKLPANTLPVPGAAVYNFKTSAWDGLTLNAGSAVEIDSPADHVSPDGLVRVRLHAGDNQMPFLPRLDIGGERAGPT